MARPFLKHYLPRSLYARAALILVIPVVTLQLVVSFAFIQRLYEGVTVQMTQNIAEEIDLLMETFLAGGDISRQARTLDIEASFPVEMARDRRLFYDLSGRVVTQTLHQRFPDLAGVDLLANPRRVLLSFDTANGPLDLNFSRRRVSATNPHQLLVLMTATALLMTVIAYLFLRNQLRPIRRLAQAAEAFGKGHHVNYRPGGALEVRSAGLSFLHMRDRIERQKEQRTMMLSGVSHDLRTPLTRLKLSLSMNEDTPENREMIADLNEMERLISSFLDFARADATEQLEPTDVLAMVREVVDKSVRAGMSVSIGALPDSAPTMNIRALAVRRALENLVGNAVRYGDRAEVSVEVLDSAVRLVVEDDGPGIPEDQRAEAIKPFARLDAARNQNRGSGVGLGLSIAADVAMSHGGRLTLGESARLGGLRAEIVLPI